MFEYYGHIHVYSPRAGADNLLASIFFSINMNFMQLPASFPHLIPFYYFYSFNPSMYYSIAITVMEEFHVDIHPRKKEVRF